MVKIKSLDKLLKVPLDNWTSSDFLAFDSARQNAPRKANLPDNVVVLDKNEALTNPLESKPFCYYVQIGDTLKSIATSFNITYAELCNCLMNTQGNTLLYAGQKIEIPRHYIDFSKVE